MYCPSCGASLKDGAKFCENCGTRIVSSGTARTLNESYYDDYGGRPRIAPGYSRRIGDEDIIAALKKQKRAGRIGAVIIVPLPLIGFLIYGAVSDSMEIGQAFLFGLIVSAIFALSALISGLKKKAEKPFEGTVTRMEHTIRLGDAKSRGGRSRDRYLVWFDGTDGKRRKKEVSLSVFNYLREGDRVRYLPQFPQPYEKNDKSRDGELLCMFCGRRQGIEQDSCSFCHNPIIK